MNSTYCIRSLSFLDIRFIARGLSLLLCVLTAGLPLAEAHGQDWPQILGPSRNGLASSKLNTAAAWPADLEPSWTASLGSGYGGAAVVGDQVLTMHRIGSKEYLESNSTKTGQRNWRAEWPTDYQPSYNPDGGPRCVPTVFDSTAICYGAGGDLAAVRITNGELLWHRQLRKETDADDGYFGAGASPLVVNEIAVVCLGGKNAGVVGINITDGTTVWTATDYDASYSSPIAVRHAGRTLALVITRLNTLLLDSASGEVLSEIRFGSRGPTVNAATPIQIDDDTFLLTASYGVGTKVIQLKDAKITELLSGSPLLSSQYNTPVRLGDRVFGIDGREDIGVAALRSIDISSRKVIWEQKDFGTAHLIGTGDQVLSLGLRGELNLFSSRGSNYVALRQTQLPQGVYRAIPALSDNMLIVRSTDGDSSRLMRFDIPKD